MIKIAPSILAADPLNLERDIRRAVEAGCDWIHVDVMDGHFVPNLAFSPAAVARIREITDTPLDVHLMLDHPEKLLDAFLDASPDILTIHAEIEADPARILNRIRERGVHPGLAVRPRTPISTIAGLMEAADLILTMTVEPGFGGQKLDETVPDKITLLKGMGYSGWVEADGGVREDNLQMLMDHGLDVAVMGTALFGLADMRSAVERMHGMKGWNPRE